MSRRLLALLLLVVVSFGSVTPAYGLEGLTWDQVFPTTQQHWEYLRVSGELNTKVTAWSASQAEAFAAYGAEMGYSGFTPDTATVGQVSAWTGQTPSQVIQSTKTAESCLKSTGVSMSPSSLKGAAVGLGVGLALELGANWAEDYIFGPHQWFDSSGNPVSDDYFLLHPFETGYLYQGDGLLFDEDIPEGIAWMFPGFEIPGALLESYEFEAVYPYNGSQMIRDTETFSWSPEWNSYYAWNSGAYTVSQMIIAHNADPAGSPLMPNFSVNLSSQASCNGWRNQITGVVTLATTTSMRINFTPYSESPGTTRVYWCDTSTTNMNAWTAAMQSSYTAAIEALETAGLIEPSREASTPVDGIDYPLPDSAELPNVYEYDGSGVDEDTAVSDAIGALDVPASVPDPVAAAGADPDAGQWADTVTPVLAELQTAAASRWPFAAIWVFTYLFDEDTCTSDLMEWTLDIEPIWLLGGPDPPPISVRLAPAEWGEPVQPYRWVGVGAVALGLLFALFGLLKPRVNV